MSLGNLVNNEWQWRHFPSAFAGQSAGRQLALSETLLTDLDAPALWWYSAHQPTLVLGTSQKPDTVDLDYCREAGIEVYRRTSGGTAVLAEPDFVSLDVALPPGHALAPTDIVETYHWLGTVWLEALQRLGLRGARLVPTEEVRAERAAQPNRPPQEIEQDKLVRLVCFGSLSPYEVAVGKRKLVGLAQIRRRAGTLLQCGLPLRAQTNRFAPLLALSSEKRAELTALLGEHIISLDELLGRVLPAEEIVAVFEETLAELWSVQLKPSAWPVEKLVQAERVEREKFANLVR